MYKKQTFVRIRKLVCYCASNKCETSCSHHDDERYPATSFNRQRDNHNVRYNLHNSTCKMLGKFRRNAGIETDPVTIVKMTVVRS